MRRQPTTAPSCVLGRARTPRDPHAHDSNRSVLCFWIDFLSLPLLTSRHLCMSRFHLDPRHSTTWYSKPAQVNSWFKLYFYASAPLHSYSPDPRREEESLPLGATDAVCVQWDSPGVKIVIIRMQISILSTARTDGAMKLGGSMVNHLRDRMQRTWTDSSPL